VWEALGGVMKWDTGGWGDVKTGVVFDGAWCVCLCGGGSLGKVPVTACWLLDAVYRSWEVSQVYLHLVQ
jgi:hypothetical protein